MQIKIILLSVPKMNWILYINWLIRLDCEGTTALLEHLCLRAHTESTALRASPPSLPEWKKLVNAQLKILIGSEILSFAKKCHTHSVLGERLRPSVSSSGSWGADRSAARWPAFTALTDSKHLLSQNSFQVGSTGRNRARWLVGRCID